MEVGAVCVNLMCQKKKYDLARMPVNSNLQFLLDALNFSAMSVIHDFDIDISRSKAIAFYLTSEGIASFTCFYSHVH